MVEVEGSAAPLLFDSVCCVTPHFEVVKKKSLKKTVEKVTGEISEGKTKLRLKHGYEDARANRTVFVGNIPSTCTKKHIKQLFKQHGHVESIRLRSLRVTANDMPVKLAKKNHHLVEGSTFNAYVVMSSSLDAEKCLKANGTFFHGRHLRVDTLAKKKINHKSVFVGNLPFSADEEKVREAFITCGAIENVRIVRDSGTGIGKGFGFVSFADTSGVMFALKQNKKIVLDKRTLRVTRSKDPGTLKQERQAKICGSKSKISISGSGKRRPDGTKNRHFRVPP